MLESLFFVDDNKGGCILNLNPAATLKKERGINIKVYNLQLNACFFCFHQVVGTKRGFQRLSHQQLNHREKDECSPNFIKLSKNLHIAFLNIRFSYLMLN